LLGTRGPVQLLSLLATAVRYVSGGFNTRFPFEKGMVFAFDFHRFAGEIAGAGTVKDIWGNDVDIAGVELILTASMLKLWSSYNSCEHYLRCCAENHYDFGVTKAVVMRAPMTCHNNIRVASIADRPEVRDWYAHMPTCTVINSWDSMAHALNGMDKDGDMVFITDNPVLLRRTGPTRTILCAQRVAEKTLPTEDSLVRSNIHGFGDDIGKITNRITAMFDVRSQFEPGSAEYGELSYRIMCGQHFQQCAIDKTKGIEARAMPKHWYDRRAAEAIEDEGWRAFCLNIVAGKKPYFMRYIYPVLMREYNAYQKSTNGKSVMEFRRRVSELAGGGEGDELDAFRHYTDVLTPVSNLDCVTNRICRRVEGMFSDKIALVSGGAFDPGILRSGAPCGKTHFRAVKAIHEDFKRYWQAEAILAKQTRRTGDEVYSRKVVANPYFRSLCYGVCSSEDTLLDILVDLCYTTSTSKQFVWDMASDAIIARLLRNSGGTIAVFTECGTGEAEVTWCGKGYKIGREPCRIDGVPP